MPQAPGAPSLARPPWIVMALLAGSIYAAFGIGASLVGGAGAPDRLGLLARWGAFLLSGLTYVLHVWSEVFRRRAGPLRVARNVAAGAAIGGFLLAVSANLHELFTAEAFRPRLLVALAAWPVLTAVPAFVGALLLAGILGRTSPRTSRS